MNTGHIWTAEEKQDLLTLPQLDFTLKYPDIGYNAYRHKKRELTPRPENEALRVKAAPQGAFVGFETIFWDLETTNLTAIMGRLLACSFATSFGVVSTMRIEDYPGASLIDDGPLAVAIRDELEKADHWVTWNGKLYDIPFLNARLLKAGERPVRSDIKHTDLMYYSRGQFVRIGSSKLDNVSKFVESPNRKTPLDWETWQMAALGDKAAMDLVVEHCEADVLVTRDVFAHLKPHIRIVHR
jgi:uncharacterized protein YprB with RNaseH-like and TPR domain